MGLLEFTGFTAIIGFFVVYRADTVFFGLSGFRFLKGLEGSCIT